jgi:hypothetical protein
MPVRVELRQLAGAVVILLFSPVWSGLVVLAQSLAVPDVPANFKLDMESAARLRPQLSAQSLPASGRYSPARPVFERLVSQAGAASRAKLRWELRIVDDDEPNAYSSPDGAVYVQSGLAKLAGPSAGLWAAILSHEIAHVLRRDWARRYLYQKYLEDRGSAGIVMGGPGTPAGFWSDSEKASADLGRFCRQMESDADREGLMLMARAGYHPDFVPALHHLLHAQNSRATTQSIYAMHPCWEERDRELSHAYVAASIEFERRWPDWYASPGGNPPVVVFAEEARVRKVSSSGWEIQIPLRCQNLAGAVEVVWRAEGEKSQRLERLPEIGASNEIRQLTGCTSPRTTVTFTLDTPDQKKSAARQTDVYVLDAWGAVLARAEVPKLPH